MKKFLIIFLLLSNNIFADNISDSHKFIDKIGNAIVTFNDKEKLIDLIEDSIDFKWVSRYVLGKNYKNINDKQRNQFVKLYQKYLINIYGPKFDNYQATSYKILSIEAKTRYNIVKTSLETMDKNKIEFAFRIKRNKSDNKFKIIDVIVEQVSLIKTHRSEFSSAILQNGMDKFLEMMQKKINNQINNE